MTLRGDCDGPATAMKTGAVGTDEVLPGLRGDLKVLRGEIKFVNDPLEFVAVAVENSFEYLESWLLARDPAGWAIMMAGPEH